VVLFYMDAAGKRSELHDMARRIGTVGYYVLVPNLYYRDVRDFDATVDREANAGRLAELMSSLDYPKITTDTQAMLTHADGDPAARPDQVGAVGYCMSGRYAYAMAGMFPDHIRAAASIYGVGLHGEGSPQHLTASITGELYFACAELDAWAPKEMIDGLEADLHNAEVHARVEWYPRCHHGFAHASRAEAFDKQACERHYERLFDLFGRNLR
jgi:carboxymethylenebutenolidase